MKKTVLRLALFTWLAALAFFVTSCSDYDNGYTEKDIEYGKDFEGIFGNADSKQDWSMAKLVKANVSVSGSSIEIYSGAPVIATSKLLVSTKLGDSSVAFNVVDGIEQVYAVVRNGKGETVVQGFYDIEDGAVNITANPLKKKTARGLYTRAVSDVTKGEVVKLPYLSVDDLEASEEVYYFNNAGPYTYDELVELVKARKNGEGNPDYYWTAPFQNCVVKDSYNNPIGWDFTNAILDKSQVVVGTPQISIYLTYLNNVEKWAAEPWVLSVGEQLFGYGGFFKESQPYFGPDKIAHYGLTAEEQLETLRKIESGFSITTKGGEIEMPFIYGATGIYDQFGYVYYKEGEDPLKQPHYVLMDNATPQANIYFDGWNISEKAVWNMQLSYWTGVSDAPIQDKTPETEVYGTKYKLAFFGENHDQTATYEFPKGYHIVFFISPSDAQAGSDAMAGYNTGTFNYSLPELNARLGHYYKNTASPTYQQGDEASRGAVKAVAWESDGITALGFEDSNDEDLNDIVFWLEGEFEADQEIVKVEVATNNESESWVFACEDLGGSFDYDFNDVVWDVYKEYKTTTTTTTENGVTTSTTVKEFIGGKVRLLAAGGTLPVELYYNEKCLGNVHELFRQQPVGTNLYHQVNVGTKADIAPVELRIPDLKITAETDINEIKHNFKVKVMGESGTSHFVIAPDMSSTAPQIILLPGEWEWPRENVAITDAYPEFTSWVQDKTWTEWAENQVSYNTVSRSKARNTTISGGDSGNAGNDSSGDAGGSDDTNNNESGNSGTTELKDPELSISSEISLNVNDPDQDVTINTNSDGAVTIIENSNSDVVTAVVDGNNKKITFTALKAGTATITVKQAATAFYTEATKTVNVTVTDNNNNSGGGNAGQATELTVTDNGDGFFVLDGREMTEAVGINSGVIFEFYLADLDIEKFYMKGTIRNLAVKENGGDFVSSIKVWNDNDVRVTFDSNSNCLTVAILANVWQTGIIGVDYNANIFKNLYFGGDTGMAAPTKVTIRPYSN